MCELCNLRYAIDDKAYIRECIRTRRYWLFVRETTGGRCIPNTKGQ